MVICLRNLARQRNESSMTKIYVLNGPNLNLLGTREPDVYGHETLADIEALCKKSCPSGTEVRFLQSNHEGALVEWIQEARNDAKGLVINPAAYTHTSVAILDALNAFEGPVAEVHRSQTHKREQFRHHSYISKRADVVILGMGSEGYAAAIRWICGKIS